MGTIYKLEFTNGKAYIGLTTGPLKMRIRDHAKCTKSSKLYAVHRAWLKHGEPTVTTLAIVDDSELHAAEVRFIREHKTKIPHGYNLTDGGEGCAGAIVSQETREKLRQHNLGKKHSAETRAKRSAALMGRTVSKETRRKIGEKNRINSLGNVLSDAAREKLRIANTGKTHTVSQEAREKMRRAKLGKKHTAEHRAKISEGNRGKVISAETRAKISAAHSGRTASDETRAAQSESAKRRGISAETRAKMNAAHMRRRKPIDEPVNPLYPASYEIKTPTPIRP